MRNTQTHTQDTQMAQDPEFNGPMALASVEKIVEVPTLGVCRVFLTIPLESFKSAVIHFHGANVCMVPIDADKIPRYGVFGNGMSEANGESASGRKRGLSAAPVKSATGSSIEPQVDERPQTGTASLAQNGLSDQTTHTLRTDPNDQSKSLGSLNSLDTQSSSTDARSNPYQDQSVALTTQSATESDPHHPQRSAQDSYTESYNGTYDEAAARTSAASANGLNPYQLPATNQAIGSQPDDLQMLTPCKKDDIESDEAENKLEGCIQSGANSVSDNGAEKYPGLVNPPQEQSKDWGGVNKLLFFSRPAFFKREVLRRLIELPGANIESFQEGLQNCLLSKKPLFDEHGGDQSKWVPTHLGFELRVHIGIPSHHLNLSAQSLKQATTKLVSFWFARVFFNKMSIGYVEPWEVIGFAQRHSLAEFFSLDFIQACRALPQIPEQALATIDQIEQSLRTRLDEQVGLGS